MNYSPEFDQLIRERLAAGGYPDDVSLLRDALTALDEIERNYRQLRNEMQSRLKSAGQGVPFDGSNLLSEARRPYRLCIDADSTE